MSYPNPPTSWMHTWLAPLYQWLVGLTSIVNGITGISWKPVRLLTAGALPANAYVHGTLTKTASVNGALGNIDGVLAVVGDRIWDNSAATGSERGLFTIISVGSGGTKWSMTRAADAALSSDYKEGKTFTVSEGTVNGGSGWLLTNATFVLDTDTPAIAENAGTITLAGDVGGPSSANTIGANKVTPAALALILGGTSAKSGPGAIDITNRFTNLTTTGTGDALTLANGAVGQEKTIIHTVDGGTGVLTPTTKLGFSTITFTNAGDTASLLWSGALGWVITGSEGVTIA